MTDLDLGLCSLRELTARYASHLVSVPPAGPGLCQVCRAGVPAGEPRCPACRAAAARYGGWAADPVGFVSLAPKGSWFAADLWRYKTDGQPGREQILTRLAAVLWRFLDRHEPCLGDRFDLVTAVPSGRDRPGPHPLAALVASVGPLVDRYQPVDAGGVEGARVLLLDDTWTTGAHLQAQATALRARGAAAVAGLALGRHLGAHHPVRLPHLAAARRPFDWDRCCLEPARPGSTDRPGG